MLGYFGMNKKHRKMLGRIIAVKTFIVYSKKKKQVEHIGTYLYKQI